MVALAGTNYVLLCHSPGRSRPALDGLQTLTIVVRSSFFVAGADTPPLKVYALAWLLDGDNFFSVASADQSTTETGSFRGSHFSALFGRCRHGHHGREK